MRTTFVPGKLETAREAYTAMLEGKILKYNDIIIRYDEELHTFVSIEYGKDLNVLSSLASLPFAKIEVFAEVTWEDDVKDSKPCICWVSNTKPGPSVVAVIHAIDDALMKPYGAVGGDYWKFATPLTLEDCWNGE